MKRFALEKLKQWKDKDNRKLNGLYLLGFHSQSYDLKNFKQEKKEEE